MTIFEKIIAREIPAHIVYEDEHSIAIMDIAPFYRGQVLVIPKTSIDYIFDIEDPLYSHLFIVARKVAKALDATFNTLRTCVVVEGFEVAHAHIKLYPLKEPHFALLTQIEITQDELAQDAEQIKNAIA